jgi:hypothetical protein
VDLGSFLSRHWGTLLTTCQAGVNSCRLIKAFSSAYPLLRLTAGIPKLEREQRLAAQRCSVRGDLEEDAMTKDDRDILELLKDELAFIQKGGYGRSVRTPWLPKSSFQDSLTCLNYGYPYRAHPCNECHLLDFVAPEHRSEVVPCHFIPLNESGETIEELEQKNNQPELEARLKGWLQARINELEANRATNFWQNVD